MVAGTGHVQIVKDYLPPPQVIKALQQRAEESGEWQPYTRLVRIITKSTESISRRRFVPATPFLSPGDFSSAE